MKIIFFVIALLFGKYYLHAQLKWSISDSIQPTLPNNLTLYFTIDSLDGKPNKAYNNDIIACSINAEVSRSVC